MKVHRISKCRELVQDILSIFDLKLLSSQCSHSFVQSLASERHYLTETSISVILTDNHQVMKTSKLLFFFTFLENTGFPSLND